MMGSSKRIYLSGWKLISKAVATLILSGRYLGYLPDHYARSFEDQGQLRTISATHFTYDSNFVAINHKAPKPSRIAQTFIDCLERSHAAE
jgi:LysR family transcriptional regulator, transcriptional activator for bauABCD operon